MHNHKKDLLSIGFFDFLRYVNNIGSAHSGHTDIFIRRAFIVIFALSCGFLAELYADHIITDTRYIPPRQLVGAGFLPTMGTEGQFRVESLFEEKRPEQCVYDQDHLLEDPNCILTPIGKELFAIDNFLKLITKPFAQDLCKQFFSDATQIKQCKLFYSDENNKKNTTPPWLKNAFSRYAHCISLDMGIRLVQAIVQLSKSFSLHSNKHA
ncbi:hypothetical protein ACQZV8_19960 [Magnetococcales bacterium HHB-1]